MRMHQNGFTLIELMFVISIIGILASIAIPNYSLYREKACISEALTSTGGIRKTIGDYYAYRGRFPDDNQMAGIPAPEQLPGKYIERVLIENGAIHIHIRFGVKKEMGVLTIRPAVVEAYPQGQHTFMAVRLC